MLFYVSHPVDQHALFCVQLLHRMNAPYMLAYVLVENVFHSFVVILSTTTAMKYLREKERKI